MFTGVSPLNVTYMYTSPLMQPYKLRYSVIISTTTLFLTLPSGSLQGWLHSLRAMDQHLQVGLLIVRCEDIHLTMLCRIYRFYEVIELCFSNCCHEFAWRLPTNYSSLYGMSFAQSIFYFKSFRKDSFASKVLVSSADSSSFFPKTVTNLGIGCISIVLAPYHVFPESFLWRLDPRVMDTFHAVASANINYRILIVGRSPNPPSATELGW